MLKVWSSYVNWCCAAESIQLDSIQYHRYLLDNLYLLLDLQDLVLHQSQSPIPDMIDLPRRLPMKTLIPIQRLWTTH
jgi:hypothetical protein